MPWFFLFFFISGFCSVLYELIWLRLSMARFGVTTAMVSVVLSVFMAGLGLGSWVSGGWLRRHADRADFPALRLYAAIEALIGVSALLVPLELGWGSHLMQTLSFSSSVTYYLVSGFWVACTLAPWCALMGATIPVGMQALRQRAGSEDSRSFSYLYMANVAGAVAGTAVPLLLIEWLGFRGTLRVGALGNGLIALGALALGSRLDAHAPAESIGQSVESRPEFGSHGVVLGLLFLTGFTSLGMEVIWVRQFTPFLGTVVYTFAAILAIYLTATFTRIMALSKARIDAGLRSFPVVDGTGGVGAFSAGDVEPDDHSARRRARVAGDHALRRAARFHHAHAGGHLFIG